LPNEDPAIVFHNGLVRLVFLGALFGGLVFYRRIQSARSQAVAGTLLLALVWGDLATHVPRQNPTVDASVFAPGLLASRMEPLPRAGESRALMTRQSHAVVYGSMLTNAVNDYLGRRGALFGDCNILDDIPVADGFYSLYLEDQRRLFEWFFWSPPDRFPAGLADFLGIVQMSDPQKMLQWQRRPSAMPFYSVGAQPVFMESSNAAALLLSPDFNPRKTVFLPVAAKAKIGPIEAGPATVREIAFAPRRMEFAVSAAGPGLLVLSQSYYHRWHAVVNGQTARIWRANEAFQAIEVPAGASGVTLVYRDGLFLTGAAISLVTLAACLAGWRRRDGID